MYMYIFSKDSLQDFDNKPFSRPGTNSKSLFLAFVGYVEKFSFF